MKLNQLFLFTLVFTIFSSCTFVRTVQHFKPSTLDHQKIFACDTVHAPLPQNLATKAYAPSLEAPLFTDATATYNFPSIDQWIPTSHRLEATYLEDFLTKSETTALLVIRNDTLLLEAYRNGGAEDKARIIFSVSKAVTSILTAIAHEEGLLNVHQKVADFIPEFGRDKRKDITIYHLMNMVSGLDWVDQDNLVKLGFLYYTKNQEKFIIKNAKLVHQPGTVHAYKSLSTQILGICLERALKRSIASYLEEKIWQPIGMKHDAYVTIDSEKNRNTRAFGGMAMTATDMARLGKLLLNHGKWNDKQIIPTWYMDDLTAARATDRNWCNDKLCFKRNGYYEGDYAHNSHYWASGYLGQFIFIDPVHQTIIVRQGDDESTKWNAFVGRLSNLLTKGSNDLTDKKLNFSDQFAGTYQTTEGIKMSLTPAEVDEYNRPTWSWQRSTADFPYHHKAETLYQSDGVSITYRTLGHYTRFFFDIKDGKVVGLYYGNTPSVTTLYLKKID